MPGHLKSRRPRRFVSHLALFVFFAFVSSCHKKDCQPLGFDEGERFQITVQRQALLRPATTECEIAPLGAGDSFVLTGGTEIQDEYLCKVRGARPDVPLFAGAVVMSCREWTGQLGLECTGMTATGCTISAQLAVGPYIARGVDTIEVGTLSIWWSMGSTCNIGGCQQGYDVRIERLGP